MEFFLCVRVYVYILIVLDNFRLCVPSNGCILFGPAFIHLLFVLVDFLKSEIASTIIESYDEYRKRKSKKHRIESNICTYVVLVYSSVWGIYGMY